MKRLLEFFSQSDSEFRIIVLDSSSHDLNDKELSQKIGNKARQLVIEKFNWDVLAKLFVKVVEARLGKNVNTT